LHGDLGEDIPEFCHPLPSSWGDLRHSNGNSKKQILPLCGRMTTKKAKANPLPAVKNDDGVERKGTTCFIDSGFLDGVCGEVFPGWVGGFY
jgi:hypothetical protein